MAKLAARDPLWWRQEARKAVAFRQLREINTHQ